jgi:hypothetical protein
LLLLLVYLSLGKDLVLKSEAMKKMLNLTKPTSR